MAAPERDRQWLPGRVSSDAHDGRVSCVLPQTSAVSTMAGGHHCDQVLGATILQMLEPGQRRT
eukprot:scaffold64486_cov52-Prasinocladus_malaysianus.AAC.1